VPVLLLGLWTALLGLWVGSTSNATGAILHHRDRSFVAIAPRVNTQAASANGRASSFDWSPAAPTVAEEPSLSGYEAAVDRYLTDVAAASRPPSPAVDNVYSVTAQYRENSSDTGSPTTMASDSFSAAGDVITAKDEFPPDAATGNAAGCQQPATVPEPADPPYTWCITDTQIQHELGSLIATRHLPSDLHAIYLVLLGPGVDVCTGPGREGPDNQCADTDFCAYHSSFSGPQAPAYAVIPWSDVSGCTSGEAPNGTGADNAGDDAANVISHEDNEIVTDPLATGWYTSGGWEVADLCALTSSQQHTIYGPPLGGLPGGEFNQIINGDHYWLQEEYSLVDAAETSADGTCEQRPGAGNGSEPASVSTPGLSYHGGAVIGAHTTIAIFWNLAGAGPNPSAAFTSSTSRAHIGQWISFSASETGDPHGTSPTYRWSFGDGTSATTTQPSVTHAYALPGRHVVALSVTDPDGQTASSSLTITIYQPPTASFTGPGGVQQAGQAASFDASASGDPDGTIEAWSWVFGDGQTAAGGPVVTHVFAHPGAYTVTLELTDSNESSGSHSETVQVLAAAASIARAGPQRVSLSNGRVLVLTGRSVSCPGATLGCSVRATLTASVTREARASRRPRTVTVKLAAASLSIAPGGRRTITLRLDRSAVELLRHLRQLRGKLAISVRTEEGVPSSAAIPLRLSAPRSLASV
jgi:PKD repeat protein